MTIRRQILGLAVVGFLLVSAAGLISYYGTSELGDAQRAARDSASSLGAVRAAETAGVMFRSDVLAAVVTKNSTERQEMLDRLGADVHDLRTGLAEAVRYEPAVAGQIRELQPTIDAMIASGQRVITLASRVESDPQQVGVAAARPVFEAEFERFSAEMPRLEKAIANRADAAADAAASTESSAKLLTLVTAGLAALVLGGAAGLLARRISRRAKACIQAAQAIATKDLTQHDSLDGTDELAEIAASLREVGTTVREAMIEIGDNAQSLSAASAQLQATGRQLAEGAETASGQARNVTANMSSVTTGIGSTAEAARGLRSSIAEIRDAVAEAGRVAGEAVELAASTNRTIQHLDNSSSEVASVVSMITTIAEQTNLLALNATIEAARAGEQGKGFAVVAGEVKELSRETATATEDIDRKVTAMRADTGGAIEAITRITDVVSRIDEIQRSISRAVDRQTAATESIGSNVDVVARSSGDIADSIGSVASATQGTHDGATQTAAAAADLAELAGRLQTLAEQFRH